MINNQPNEKFPEFRLADLPTDIRKKLERCSNPDCLDNNPESPGSNMDYRIKTKEVVSDGKTEIKNFYWATCLTCAKFRTEPVPT